MKLAEFEYSQPVPQVKFFVPGRIEVLGKHTDYAGGRSLLAAADHGITFTAFANKSRIIRVYSAETDSRVEIDIDNLPTLPPGHWAGYVVAVIERIGANFPELICGVDIELRSTLPMASGMSSSSALVVGLARCLIDICGIGADPRFSSVITTAEEFATYLACVENGMSYAHLVGHRGVGTFGGSEDHTAMMCCEKGKLSQYKFCPTAEEATVNFPENHAFVVAVSGVLAEKTGAARGSYNRASLATRELIEIWRKETGRAEETLADVVDLGQDALKQLRIFADANGLRARLDHFTTEAYELIPAAVQALKSRDLVAFGDITDASQRGSEELLKNQVAETIALQDVARKLGAVGASAFGAGFGGSVWALVPVNDAENFGQVWLDQYLRQFPGNHSRARYLVTTPGGPARRIR